MHIANEHLWTTGSEYRINTHRNWKRRHEIIGNLLMFTTEKYGDCALPHTKWVNRAQSVQFGCFVLLVRGASRTMTLHSLRPRATDSVEHEQSKSLNMIKGEYQTNTSKLSNEHVFEFFPFDWATTKFSTWKIYAYKSIERKKNRKNKNRLKWRNVNSIHKNGMAHMIENHNHWSNAQQIRARINTLARTTVQHIH